MALKSFVLSVESRYVSANIAYLIHLKAKLSTLSINSKMLDQLDQGNFSECNRTTCG